SLSRGFARVTGAAWEGGRFSYPALGRECRIRKLGSATATSAAGTTTSRGADRTFVPYISSMVAKPPPNCECWGEKVSTLSKKCLPAPCGADTVSIVAVVLMCFTTPGTTDIGGDAMKEQRWTSTTGPPA